MQRKLVAVDWGTSSLRGALINREGVVLEKRAFPQGILQVAHGQFQHVFEQRFGDWMAADTLCLISGMAGSRQGWREAPYCPCPSVNPKIAQEIEDKIRANSSTLSEAMTAPQETDETE